MNFGATILDPLDLRLSAEEKAFFRDADPFGFILFARNLDTPDQIRALCNDLRDAVGRDAPITIDQEGGRVQRLRAPVWREWTPPLEFVTAAGENAVAAMYLRYRLIAHELRTLGIDSNCAPLVDVANDATHPFLRNRCYGTAAARVAELGRAVADGLLDGGVLPVVKHIPGHGRADADSHLSLPQIDASHEVLSSVDFEPFRQLNRLPVAMTAHVVYSAIDNALPVSTSASSIEDIIRGEIGFDGFLMCDDVSMEALDGTIGERTKAVLTAGCDGALHCNGKFDEMEQVAENSPLLEGRSLERFEASFTMVSSAEDVDETLALEFLAEDWCACS